MFSFASAKSRTQVAQLSVFGPIWAKYGLFVVWDLRHRLLDGWLA